MSTTATPTVEVGLDQIARRRAIQTALQGLAVDVLVALAVVIMGSLDSITSRAAAITLAVTLGKTAVATACAWVVRRYADRSGVDVPTQIVS